MHQVSHRTCPRFPYPNLGIVPDLSYAICIYPYLFIWTGLEAKSRIDSLSQKTDGSSLIRFYDQYRKLRFIIAPEAVLNIKSKDNHAQIHYMDKGKPQKFILRSSMKA